MDRETRAAANRANFPYAAGVMDELRKQFGPGVRLVYAEENGQTLGRKPDDSKFINISGRDMVLNIKKVKS